MDESENHIWGFTPETGLYIQGIDKPSPVQYYMQAHDIY